MKEYNVQIKVRNNYLLQMMRDKGYETAAQLSRATGVHEVEIGKYLNLKQSATSKYGVRKPVVEICGVLGCEPEDIFPAAHFHSPLDKNRAEVVLGIDEVRSLVSPTFAESLVERLEQSAAVKDALESLTEREQTVLKLRHGFDGDPKTLKEVGSEFGLSVERTRQIEAKALRKLRHPSRCTLLQEYV